MKLELAKTVTTINLINLDIYHRIGFRVRVKTDDTKSSRLLKIIFIIRVKYMVLCGCFIIVL